MSDNQDKRLEDLGWEKMSALLDKEMPVEKSPRRGLIWWWMAAGFALLVAAISLLPFEKKSAQQIASQEITHENNKNINIVATMVQLLNHIP